MMADRALASALEEFRTVYMPARNLSFRTRIEYTHDLQGLIAFLQLASVSQVGEIQTRYIDQYLTHLEEQGMSGSTRERKAITFRAFLAFLYRSGDIRQDISRQVIVPFSETPIPWVLTQSEYQWLLQTCAGNIRDTAIIMLLLQTGIRLSELTNTTAALSSLGVPGAYGSENTWPALDGGAANAARICAGEGQSF